MRIHTDKLTTQDLWSKLPDGVDMELTTHGSRKRDHAFEVKLAAAPGNDAHGIKRAYAQNNGQWGAEQNGMRAATYIEWGDWMVELFKIDPAAIIGPYDGPDAFVEQTHRYAPHRRPREHAEEHAVRWSTDLFYARDTEAAARLR